MFDHYEWFKKEVYRLTQIDLNYYKEKQMRRRIDTLARKNGADSYETYIDMISADKAKFKQFINFITINVSEFYRNPDQWSFLDREVIPEILKNNTGTIKIWSAACSSRGRAVFACHGFFEACSTVSYKDTGYRY